MPDLYDQLNQKLDAEEPAPGAVPFDQLSAKLDAHDPPAGITTMDIMELEADQRSVMLMIMRDPNKVDGVPLIAIEQRFAERMADLAGTLRELITGGWLIELGEEPNLRDRVHLRTRRGSAGSGLWSALSDRAL